MKYLAMLTFAYCVIFTFFNFAVFVIYYLFGFTYDVDYRKIGKRFTLPRLSLFLFHFKGATGKSRINPTRLVGGCEVFAVLYFIFSELFCFLSSQIIKDLVIICRLSILFFVIAFTAFMVIALTVIIRIKKYDKKEAERQLREYLTPKETIDIDDSEDIDFFVDQPHEKPARATIDLMTKISNADSPDRETTDVSQGMESVSEKKDNLINKNNTSSIIPPAKNATGNEPERETTDVAEGMEAVDEIKKNLLK